MKTFKRIIRVVSKVIGYVARFVLFFSPFTNTGLAQMAVSGVVALICFVAYMWSEPEEDYRQRFSGGALRRSHLFLPHKCLMPEFEGEQTP